MEAPGSTIARHEQVLNADSGPSSRPRGDRVLLAALMLFVAATVTFTYWPVLSAKSLFSDDFLYIVQNDTVANPSWSSVARFLREVTEPTTVPGYYEPLPMITLMLDYAMGGHATGGPDDNLRPFRRTALFFHVLNSLLVVVLVYVLFGRPWAAAVVGLLFGLHPLQVESTAWISQRKTMLGTFFAFSCLIFYVRYVRTAGVGNYLASLAACVLALMSKPTALPLPVLLVLMDYWPLARLRWRTIVEKLPFFVIASISGIITLLAMSRTAYLDMPTEVGAARIPLILCHNIGFYLWKIVWPAQLSAFYPFPEPLGLSHPMVLAGVIATVALALVLLISLRWSRAFMAGWLIFFIAIFPALGVFKVTPVIAADRYVYLPLIGMAMVIGWMLSRVWTTTWWIRRPSEKQAVAAALVAVVAIAEAVGTRGYVGLWQDNVFLFRHMVQFGPNQDWIQRGLVNSLIRQGSIGAAINQLGEWSKQKPDLVAPRKLQGTLLAKRGRLDEARRAWDESLRLDPNSADIHCKLAHLSLLRGQVDRAVEHCNASLRLDPNLAQARFILATSMLKLGKLDSAVGHFTDGLKLEPDDAQAHHNLAVALIRLGKSDQAVDHFERALRLKPDFESTREALKRARASREQ